MKIYIICDLEGTAGVVDFARQCCFDGEYYWQARQNATAELNAVVEGALDFGVDEIVAWDGHGPFPGGLDVDILHPACKLVMGAGDGGPQGLDENFDALLQCGLHARAGTPRAVLAHSFMGHIAGIWVNDILWGEIAMNAHIAGMLNIPCIFIAGDQAAADEARELIFNIETAVVKQGLSPAPINLSKQSPALSHAPEKAQEIIKEATIRALERCDEIQPFHLEAPYTIRTCFYKEEHAGRAAGQPGIIRLDAFTVEKRDLPEIDLVF